MRMNPTPSINEGDVHVVLVDGDIEESKDAVDENETRIETPGPEVDIVVQAEEEETIAKLQNTSQTTKGFSHEKKEHISIVTHVKNSNGSRKCRIPCAFAVVAVASGATGALIARRQSPSAITTPGATQSTIRPITERPTTAEKPTPGPTAEPTTTSSSTTLPPSPRQSTIFDAFVDYGPVHKEAFEWLLNTDEWTPSAMGSDKKHLWHERYAVATFLYSTNVQYLVNSVFRTTNPVCQWAGVGCSNGLEVDTLEFSNSMLSGSLPTEIGILTGLSYLDIANNNVGGSLPSEIGFLSDLEDVMLSHNAMTGTFPSELGMIKHPWFLYADNNRFSGSLPSELGKFLGIDLSFNDLSGNLPSDLFDDRLSMLILNDNELTGSLPVEVITASQLTTLWLWNNELSGTIPPLNEILSSCKLQNNSFSDTTNGGFCLL